MKRLVTTTAYSHHETDHLKYGARTAMGTPLRYDDKLRSAAADWSVYPAGTVLRVAGHPWNYVVDDYGSALVGTSVIDLYQPDLGKMRAWGRRRVEVTILRWGCYELSARVLRSRVHHAHCRAMFEAIRNKAADASRRSVVDAPRCGGEPVAASCKAPHPTGFPLLSHCSGRTR